MESGPHRLTYRQAEYAFGLYPVADKVCATMDTHYPGGKRGSRVKDLVDLVVIACTQTVDLDELRVAIDSKRELSDIAPFEHFGVPTEWARTYPATAKGVPVAEPLSAQTAAGLVASFVDRALGKSANPAVWDPHALAWIRGTSSPAEATGDA